MNWGIIGLGYMAKNFTQSIKELNASTIIGASSRSFLKLIKYGFRNKIRYENLYKNYEKILECKEIDNIYISTVNSTHHNLIINCIKAGKNILCEKPFVVNLEEANNIKNKLKNSNIFFLEAIPYIVHPQILEVLKLLKNNVIGKITNIKSNFGSDKGPPSKAKRLFNKDLGGGAILDLGCYPISISNIIANYDSNKEQMIPVIKNVSGESHKLGIDLNAKAELTYDNSIISEISVSLNKDLDNTTEIIGTEGIIKILNPWTPGKKSFFEVYRHNDINKIEVNSKFGLFANQINFFNNCAKNKKLNTNYPAMNIDNSVNYVKLITKWKELLNSYENKSS